jgi:competence protein ComEC
LRKHTGIIFKNGNQGVVLTDLPETDKNFKYAIQPGLDSSQLTDYKVYPLNKNIQLPYLQKQGNLVAFQNKKLLLLNDSSQIQSIPQQVGVNYLYISDDAFVDTAVIKNKTLIIAGSNSDKYIAGFKEDIKIAPVNYKVIKRNKSVCIVSNPYK